ncbi:MAG: glycosyltransferase [Euryarchaeota archaeon]|nr:glycosyltransferase [Euryarchaeota archaeon]
MAELLRGHVALLRGLGIDAHWQVLRADGAFFDATKRIHNALQGARVEPTVGQWAAFDQVNRRVARAMDARRWDFVVVHDPQPGAVLLQGARRGRAKWVWRCHIDSERPHRPVLRRIQPALRLFDGCVFSRRAYAFSLPEPKRAIMAPAIDPTAPKNMPMGLAEARRTVARFDVDPDRPLLLQVSRFDPWKDQAGTVQAWRAARRRVPGLQLALVGCSADDDPEAASVVAQVERQVRGLAGAFVLQDCVDDRALKAFLDCASVVMQKSIREGFGLTVAEALWAGRPVVGGRVGGIPLQVRDGREGFLVKDPAEAASRVVRLLRDPALAARLGRAGRAHVKRRFLLPRLVLDELRFLAALGDAPAARRATRVARRPRRRSRSQDHPTVVSLP